MAPFGLMATLRELAISPHSAVSTQMRGYLGYLHVNAPIFHTNVGYLHVNGYGFHTKRLAKRLANLG